MGMFPSNERFEILDLVDRFDTSIDGIGEIHERIRGRGTYRKTIAMVERALEKGNMGVVSITFPLLRRQSLHLWKMA